MNRVALRWKGSVWQHFVYCIAICILVLFRVKAEDARIRFPSHSSKAFVANSGWFWH